MKYLKPNITMNPIRSANASYKYGDSINDIGCHLNGQKCGINMVFSSWHFQSLNFCKSYCICESGNFIVKDGQCVMEDNESTLQDDLKNDTSVLKSTSKTVSIFNLM